MFFRKPNAKKYRWWTFCIKLYAVNNIFYGDWAAHAMKAVLAPSWASKIVPIGVFKACRRILKYMNGSYLMTSSHTSLAISSALFCSPWATVHALNVFIFVNPWKHFFWPSRFSVIFTFVTPRKTEFFVDIQLLGQIEFDIFYDRIVFLTAKLIQIWYIIPLSKYLAVEF